MSEWRDLGKIGAAVATLTGALAAVSESELLQRMSRNHPGLLSWALVCVVVASALWVAAALVKPDTKPEKVLQTSGLGLFVLGVLVALVGAIKTQGDVERPLLGIKLDRAESTVTATAKVANLSSNRRLAVVVDGLEIEGTLKHVMSYEETNLFRGFLGPNSQGVVDQTIDLPLPPGRYDALGIRGWTASEETVCEDYSKQAIAVAEAGIKESVLRTSGCIVIVLPPVPERPTLSLQSGEADAVTVAVAGENVGLPTSVLVVARVGGKEEVLYRATFEGPQKGSLQVSEKVPVPEGAKRVCAYATFVSEEPTPVPGGCPGAATEGAYADLRT